MDQVIRNAIIRISLECESGNFDKGMRSAAHELDGQVKSISSQINTLHEQMAKVGSSNLSGATTAAISSQTEAMKQASAAALSLADQKRALTILQGDELKAWEAELAAAKETAHEFDAWKASQNSQVDVLSKMSVGLGVLTLALNATRTAYREATATSRDYWNSITGDASTTHRFLAGSAQRSLVHAHDVAMSAPNFGEIQRFVPQFQARMKREEMIRDFESGDAPAAQKAAFRQRVERAGNADEDREVSEDTIKFKQQQLADLKKAHAGFLTDQKNVESAGRNAIKAARDELEHSTDESKASAAARKAVQFATGQYNTGNPMADKALGLAMYANPFHDFGKYVNTGIDRQSGLWNEQANAKDQARLQFKQTQERVADENAKAKGRVVESDRNQKLLAREIADAEKKRATTTWSQLQASYQDVFQERERVRSGNIAFGSSDVMHQFTAMRLQEKHERIEKQRADNKAAGRPIDQDVEQYNLWEMQQSPMGGIAGISMRRQAEAVAKRAGFKLETDLPDREKALEAEKKKEIGLERVGAADNEVADAARKMAQAVKEALPLKELAEQFTKEIEDLRREIQRNGILRQHWF